MEPRSSFLQGLTKHVPGATAQIQGNADYPQLNGIVRFYELPYLGLMIETELYGLPLNEGDAPRFFGMHIHEEGNCSKPFDKTGSHYNPENLPHPQHAGDLLPLLGNQGFAWSVFYDSFLTLNQIVGRSVIVHEKADDFTSQPSGNAGNKIGCGVIQRTAP